MNLEIHACKESTLSLTHTLSFVFMFLDCHDVRAREIGQKLKAFVLAENLGSTHMAGHNHP